MYATRLGRQTGNDRRPTANQSRFKVQQSTTVSFSPESRSKCGGGCAERDKDKSLLHHGGVL
jgi:hypothetical protein